MKYLPVSWNLEGRKVTVIGGGQVAQRRVEALLDCGADITLIAPETSPEIESLVAAGRLRHRSRKYRQGDLAGAWAVFTGTDDREVNEAAWLEARKRGIPVNVADVPDKCDFIMPATVRSGHLSVAVSTDGRSPALAARLRRRLSIWFGPEYGELLDVLDSVRHRLKREVADPEVRKRIHYRLVDSDLLECLRRGDRDALLARIEGIINEEPVPDVGGKVYIVGAGPGDPGLITRRGLYCLQEADAVLHDRLIDPRLLEEAKEGAEIIDVGKRAGQGGRSQAFIQSAMIERARAGQLVCRLKGGDPFVFGRGGEETLALIQAQVPFEIIPGVTSALAAPASAGIPVTHRDMAHAFMVMTGSRAENAEAGEWLGARSVIDGGGTLVVLMGLSRLEAIARRLLEAGCSASTPAALVSRGTFPEQEVRVGTLGDLKERAAGLVSPAVIVFGQVVGERARLTDAVAGGEGRSLPKSPE